MEKSRGPVDDDLERLAEFLIKHRGTPFSKLPEEARKDFQKEVSKMMKFIVRIGFFATTDTKLIEAMFYDFLGGLRAQIGFIEWIRSAKWLLAMISRGLTPSGKLYVQVRQRIRVLGAAGIRNSPDATPPEFDLDLRPFAFDDKFTGEMCSLKTNKKNKQINSLMYCARGCDLLLLQHLAFEEITIGRIHGLKPGTTANRMLDCADVNRKARHKFAPGLPTPRQQEQSNG